MDIIEKYCNKNFKHYEKNILSLIEKDMDDGMEMVYIKRNDLPNDNGFYILMARELLNIFQNIEDYVYDLEIIDNIKKKIEWMERKQQYLPKDEKIVNKFIVKSSIVILIDNNDNSIKLRKYLKDNCKNYKDLLRYAVIIKSGWIKPKFNCVKVLLNDLN
jgi:hypothetical protein